MPAVRGSVLPEMGPRVSIFCPKQLLGEADLGLKHVHAVEYQIDSSKHVVLWSWSFSVSSLETTHSWAVILLCLYLVDHLWRLMRLENWIQKFELKRQAAVLFANGNYPTFGPQLLLDWRSHATVNHLDCAVGGGWC